MGPFLFNLSLFPIRPAECNNVVNKYNWDDGGSMRLYFMVNTKGVKPVL